MHTYLENKRKWLHLRKLIHLINDGNNPAPLQGAVTVIICITDGTINLINTYLWWVCWNNTFPFSRPMPCQPGISEPRVFQIGWPECYMAFSWCAETRIPEYPHHEHFELPRKLKEVTPNSCTLGQTNTSSSRGVSGQDGYDPKRKSLSPNPEWPPKGTTSSSAWGSHKGHLGLWSVLVARRVFDKWAWESLSRWEQVCRWADLPWREPLKITLVDCYSGMKGSPEVKERATSILEVFVFLSLFHSTQECPSYSITFSSPSPSRSTFLPSSSELVRPLFSLTLVIQPILYTIIWLFWICSSPPQWDCTFLQSRYSSVFPKAA